MYQKCFLFPRNTGNLAIGKIARINTRAQCDKLVKEMVPINIFTR